MPRPRTCAFWLSSFCRPRNSRSGSVVPSANDSLKLMPLARGKIAASRLNAERHVSERVGTAGAGCDTERPRAWRPPFPEGLAVPLCASSCHHRNEIARITGQSCTLGTTTPGATRISSANPVSPRVVVRSRSVSSSSPGVSPRHCSWGGWLARSQYERGINSPRVNCRRDACDDGNSEQNRFRDNESTDINGVGIPHLVP